MLDLEAIKRREAAATAGPWESGCASLMVSIHRPGQPMISGIAGNQIGDLGENWGRDSDFMAHAREDIPALIAEVERLRGIIAQHNLCHDLHGKVSAEDFAKGCEAEQRRIYGCAPDADNVGNLSMLTLQLVRKIRKQNPYDDLAEKALRFLDRKGLLGSPLRGQGDTC